MECQWATNGMSIIFQWNANWWPMECHLTATWCKLTANWVPMDYQWTTNWYPKSANWLPVECHLKANEVPLEYQCSDNWLQIDCKLIPNWKLMPESISGFISWWANRSLPSIEGSGRLARSEMNQSNSNAVPMQFQSKCWIHGTLSL